jgi:heme/copper-type cytochrome/quinol oxidase subunit 2
MTRDGDAGFGIEQRAALLDGIAKGLAGFGAGGLCHRGISSQRRGVPVKRLGVMMVPAVLAGCDSGLSALAPAGPAAAQVAGLWWAMLAAAGGLTALVLVLVAMGFGAPRPLPARRWTHGLGLWFSLAVLAAFLAGGLWVGERLMARDAAGVVTVRAHAEQWGWRFTQPGPDGPAETRGVLHIPAGRTVEVVVTSADVIHAFWVPRLAGKIDAVPGRENRLRLQADAPGRYDGLCAEFCGLGHAAMRFEVIAHPPEDWPGAVGEGSEE